VFRKMTGFWVDDCDTRPYAKHIRVPTLVVQVKDDLMTKASGIQEIYNNIPVADKKLFWIEGTPLRHHGYTYFSEHPEPMLEWFATHMGRS
jgi:hypothetical protein